MERTLVLVKPDALQRQLVGEVIRRIEQKGLRLVGLKMMLLTEDLLDDHYRHLKQLPFFQEIKRFMASAPVVACCWEGLDAVETVRSLCGVTKAREAAPGTIRGDLAMSVQDNLIHASDSRQAANEEIDRFFTTSELHTYDQVLINCLYSTRELGGSA